MYTWMSRLLLLLLFLLLFFLLRLNPREQESQRATHAVELFLIVTLLLTIVYPMRSATILLEQPLFFFSFVFATFVYSAIRMISPVRERETIPCRVKNTDERIAR